MRRPGHRHAGRLGLGEQRVHVGHARYDVADAELAALWLPERDVDVLGSSVLGYSERISARPSWNIATAPAGVVLSPTNSVPPTPADSSPGPSR